MLYNFSKDELFEALIKLRVDGISFAQALETIIGRPLEIEEFRAADAKLQVMRDGWVRMNENIRRKG